MLPRLTASVSFDAMRRRASQARGAFSLGVGGLAYNYTILALCHRAVELRGALKAEPGASCGARRSQRRSLWPCRPLGHAWLDAGAGAEGHSRACSRAAGSASTSDRCRCRCRGTGRS